MDIDSTICKVYGRRKQSVAFGYTKVRGYHPQLATVAETTYICFAGTRHAMTVRLVVRRVRPTPDS